MTTVEIDQKISDLEDGFHKIITPDGIVWFPKGINPDRVYGEQKGRNWPYSNVIAALICQCVTEGKGLVEISKQEGFPPYSEIIKWKRKPEFKAMLTEAQKHKAEYHAERAIALAGIGFANKLQVDTLKWSASAENPEKYTQTKKKVKVEPIKLEIKK